jgi:hypothetical protein
VDRKEPLTEEDAKLLGQVADLIKEGRDLFGKVSAKDASEIGRLLQELHGMLDELLSKGGEPTKRLD